MLRGSWVLTSLLNFLIAATFGLLMRGAFVWEFEWMKYQYVLHAHSHVAMLGWVYLIFFALFLDRFVPAEKSKKPVYTWLFWLTQATVIAMMISFPLEGYGPFSISFSAAHILLSYAFVWQLWKDLSAPKNAKMLLKAALLSLVLSTIGIWGMAPVMAFGLQSSPWYFIAIQFYLHFQFNGWFVLGALALLFRVFDQYQIQITPRSLKLFLSLYVIGMLLTFSHVLAWAYGREYMYILNSGGVLFQLAAVGYFFLLLLPQLRARMSVTLKYEKLLLVLALVSLAIKAIFQALLVIPPLAEVSTIIRNFMIGYIHLITLGIATMVIFLALNERLPERLNLNWGLPLFLIGFVGTEILLFFQGMLYWGAWGMMGFYYELLFVLSAFLHVGLLVLLMNNLHLIGIRGKELKDQRL